MYHCIRATICQFLVLFSVSTYYYKLCYPWNYVVIYSSNNTFTSDSPSNNWWHFSGTPASNVVYIIYKTPHESYTSNKPYLSDHNILISQRITCKTIQTPDVPPATLTSQPWHLHMNPWIQIGAWISSEMSPASDRNLQSRQCWLGREVSVRAWETNGVLLGRVPGSNIKPGVG